MHKVPGALSLAALFFLTAAFTLAQDAAPSRESELTIRHTVQEVVLDVVVRDARGRIVKNLKPGDLQVFEDGTRQEIRSFKLVQGHDVVVGKPNAAPGAAPPVAVAPSPMKAINLICIVF